MQVVVLVLVLLGSAAVILASANTGWELTHHADRDWYLGRQVGRAVELMG
jgi:hypothetical protein